MFGLTDTLVFTGLSLSLLTLSLFIVSLFQPRAGLGMLITSIGGAVSLLVAPAYLFFVLPPTMSMYSSSDYIVNGFFGSCGPSGSGTHCAGASWGGGVGWFLAIAASLVLQPSTVGAFFHLRRLNRTASSEAVSY
jgi:hypothetical protein